MSFVRFLIVAFIVGCLSVQARAALLADLRANYQATAVGNSTAAFGGGLGLPDTFGTGHWNYGKTAPGVFTPPGAMTLLTFYAGGTGGNAGFPGYGDATDAGFFRIPLVGIDKHFNDGSTPAANQISFHPNNAGTGTNDIRWTAGAGEAGLVTLRGTLDRTGEPGGLVTLLTYVNGVLVNTQSNVANGQSASFAVAANIAVGQNVDIIAQPNGCCATESKLSFQIFSAGVNPVVNGSFEFPTPISAGNNFDTQTPTGWSFTPSGLPYVRIGSGGFGYPAAADGTTIYGVEGDRGGVLFQDLGTMIPGETYKFDGVVSSSTGNNSYRASFITDPLGAALEAAFITQANFNPGAGASLDATFSYTATAADAGKMLRLALSDNGTTSATRSAFDNVRVSVIAAAVPEPASLSLLALGGVALLRRRRAA